MPVTELDVPEPDPVPATRSRTGDLASALFGDTLAGLLIDNVRAAAASLTLYVLFRVGEKSTELVDTVITLSHDASAEFFKTILSWGGALSGAAVWLIFTIIQLINLPRDLRGKR